MNRKAHEILTAACNLRMIVFLITLANFLWFFSQSRVVVEYGQSSPSFFQQPWYWQPCNISYVSLIAAVFLIIGSRRSYWIAALLSALEIINGVSWLSVPQGFFAGLLGRMEIVARVDWREYQELVDWQYLLAVLIFAAAAGCLIKKSATPAGFYP